jgi:uncharacterized protein YjcR
MWLESGGELSPSEIAKALGQNPATVRGWKSRDKWELNPKQGAPTGNTNAVITGAYAKIYGKAFTPEELQIAEQVIEQAQKGKDTLPNLLATLTIRESRMLEASKQITDHELKIKFENALTRIQAEIRRCKDSINNYELAQKKYTLLKQKLTGEFNIDPDTGDICDLN